ncbi:MAG: FtsX-like permease family protein [Gemmatimonadaceae bacterium]
MSNLEMSIAWRYLRSRSGSKLLSFISVIAIGGVLVGVSALIIIMGVMNGLQSDLRDKLLVASPDIRVLKFGDDLKISDSTWPEALERVRKFPGIVAAAPFVMTQGAINAAHDYTEAVQVVGIQPSGKGVQEVTDVRRHIIPGQGDFRFATTSKDTLIRGGAVLGKRIADRMGVFVGDKISVYTGKWNRSMGVFIPKQMRLEVTGVFESGMYEYDNSYVYVPLAAAQEIASLGGAVTGIEARTTSHWEANVTASELAKSLGFPYRVLDWQQQNSSLFSALRLEKLAMGVILLLIVLVAAFNIVSTLTMVVKDKTREIGILKAQGMTSRSIRRIFFAQGLVIGLVGTVIGLVLGVALGAVLNQGRLIKIDPSVYFIDHLPVKLQPLDVTWIVLASIAIAAVATLYPAIQAARLYPVEAIRHE